MKLLHLKAHNVFSVGTVEFNLKDRGLLLVTGWSYDENNGNMAGKSSVARNSIVWGLYGKTVDGVKADSVCNTSIKNAKHCGVWLRFEGVDGEEYRIYRSRKPNELVLSQKTYDREMRVVWQDLSKRLDRDTQELINKLLGRDHKTFIQSDFFGQGRERSFLSLPGSEQRAVIEEILPLTSLEQWRVTAKEMLKDADVRVENAKVEQRITTDRVDGVRNKLETLRGQQTAWANERSAEVSEILTRLNNIRGVSQNLNEALVVLRQGIPESMSAQEFLDNEQKEVNALTSLNTSAQYQIDTLTGEIDTRSARPDVCTLCHQSLPEDRIEENRQDIEGAKEKRGTLIRQKGENEAHLYNAQANIGIAKEALDIEKKLEEKAEVTILTDLVASKKAQINPFDTTVKAYLTELEKETAINDNYRNVIAEEARVRDHYHFWHHAFGTDLKTLMFEKVCPFLEDKTNQYLSELNNPQIKVSFGIAKEMKSGKTKDEFCVTALTTTGSNVFELFSGAEQQLTSFAVGMALSDLAAMQVEGASKFMILDEPFLYQSPENCENIVNFIRTHKMGDGSTILLISNEENLASLIPNRIHIVKKNGVSSIEH